jgi:2-polyprenyl-6-methoxyphenol hydroxylase-like FAD-dependent oxidoreductase
MSTGATALPARTDVVVVGAGPTGLALACGLAARGIEPLVLDRVAQGGNTSRAAVVHARTLEVLEDIEVTEHLLRLGVVVPRFTIRDRDRPLLAIPFQDLPTKYPYTLMLPQDVTERILGERLAALGGRVRRSLAVTGVAIGDDGAEVTVAGADGSSVPVHARYVVGCDGMHSAVREKAGIGFTGDRYAQSFVLADVGMDWRLPRDEVNLFFSPNGLVVVAPLPRDLYRIVATLDDAPETLGIDDVQALLDARGPATAPAAVRHVEWSSRFRVHHRVADSYRNGPAFLAGDAAHVHSPAGGQGMNTGIQDAIMLAELLADVVGGDAPAADLDRYETVRRPVALGVVAMTHRLSRAATARHPLTRLLRNTALQAAGRLRPVRHAFAMNLSELNTRPTPTDGRTRRRPSDRLLDDATRIARGHRASKG